MTNILNLSVSRPQHLTKFLQTSLVNEDLTEAQNTLKADTDMWIAPIAPNC